MTRPESNIRGVSTINMISPTPDPAPRGGEKEESGIFCGVSPQNIPKPLSFNPLPFREGGWGIGKLLRQCPKINSGVRHVIIICKEPGLVYGLTGATPSGRSVFGTRTRRATKKLMQAMKVPIRNTYW